MRKLESGSDYEEAGRLHLADARELLEHPTHEAFHNQAHIRHLRGAMHLAGYAVECALKSYLVRKHGKSTFDEVIPVVRSSLNVDLRGANLHSLRELWRAAGFTGVPADVASSIGQCAAWRVEWRYDPTVGKARQDARQFVRAAELLWDWIARQP